MFIRKTIERDDGTFTIEGDFSAAEVDIILGVGINTLFARGAMPFKNITEENIANLHPTAEGTQ